jgi:hypothetical protein
MERVNPARLLHQLLLGTGGRSTSRPVAGGAAEALVHPKVLRQRL